VTSPPYWGLRDYGHDGQLGLEKTPEEYIARLVEVFREVRRVLSDDGTLWLNLGDSYAAGCMTGRQGSNSTTGRNVGQAEGTSLPARKPPNGLKPKDLVGIPWRVAFALQLGNRGCKKGCTSYNNFLDPTNEDANRCVSPVCPKCQWPIEDYGDGWYLRSDIIWHKPNPMPESVTDRPTKAHEYMFLLAKSQRYYYDAAAIAEQSITGLQAEQSGYAPPGQPPHSRSRSGSGNKHRVLAGPANGRLETHMGSGVPWQDTGAGRNRRSVWSITTEPFPGAHFAVMPTALVEPCILAGSAKGDTVLDPFTGSGTVGVVALRHGRDFVGCELNPEYVDMARRRINGPLFSECG
jgi:DNA modification methylase